MIVLESKDGWQPWVATLHSAVKSTCEVTNTTTLTYHASLHSEDWLSNDRDNILFPRVHLYKNAMTYYVLDKTKFNIPSLNHTQLYHNINQPELFLSRQIIKRQFKLKTSGFP